jgi:exonuclease V gamma subunit
MHAEINAQRTEMLQQLTKLHNELTEEVKEFKTKNIESFTREIIESLTDMFTKKKQIHPKRLKTIETQLQSFERKIEDVKEPN